MRRAPTVMLRPRRLRSLGLTGRWTLAALAAFVVYRAMPYEPDAELTAAVAQHLRFHYSQSRTPEMKASARQHDGDALLAAAEDVLNARVVLESIEARGPILPPPLPRRIVVRVNYRIMNRGEQLESQERYLEFRKPVMGDWQYSRDWNQTFYWLYPL